MATLKLSQIAPAAANPAATDQFVGVQGGGTDELFTLTQIAGGLSGNGFTRTILTANTNYYVALTGSDSNPGTLALPWATPQHAYQFILSTLDLAGFTVTVNFADGTYSTVQTVPLIGSAILVMGQPPVGGGEIIFVGNIATPSNVIWSNSTGAPASGVILLGGNAATSSHFHFDGMKIQTSGNSGMYGIAHQSTGNISIGDNSFEFGACTGDQLYIANPSAFVEIQQNYTISGGGLTHIHCFFQAGFYTGASATVSGNPNFSDAFVDCDNLSLTWFDGGTITGAATGQRFKVDKNSIINTDSGGPNFFPGNVAGTQTNGGLYL